jgi:hypothetical protein
MIGIRRMCENLASCKERLSSEPKDARNSTSERLEKSTNQTSWAVNRPKNCGPCSDESNGTVSSIRRLLVALAVKSKMALDCS